MEILKEKGISLYRATDELFIKVCNYYYSNASNGLGLNLSKLYISSLSGLTYNKHPRVSNISNAYMVTAENPDPIVVDRSDVYYHSYNLMNDLIHEYWHLENDKDVSVDDYRHLNAYESQIKHIATWTHTTSSFQDIVIKTVGMYLFSVSKFSDIYGSDYAGYDSLYEQKRTLFEDMLNVEYDFSLHESYYKNNSQRIAPISNISYQKK